MNCSHALVLMEFNRPGATELEAADIASLESHLASCRACSAFAQSDRQWTDQMVQAAGNAIPPPANSIDAIKQSLAQKRHRWQLTRAIWAVGLVGFAAATWWAIPGPYLDPQLTLTYSTDQIGNRAGATDWLVSINSRFKFPPRFRDVYLVSYERRSQWRTNAPVLTFVHGNSMARVMVLTERQFRNLREFGDERVAENSLGSIHILREAGNPGVVYLVEVINGPLEPFLEQPAAAT